MNVLVVDDDKIIREDIRNLIDWQACGFTLVGEAANGEDASHLIQSQPIDILITDIYMPVMNGIELIKSAKQNYPGIQIVVMSNFDDFEYVKDAMKYGALDYFLKYQINSASLLELLMNAKAEVERYRRENEEKVFLMQVASREKSQAIQLCWSDFINGRLPLDQAWQKARALGIAFPRKDFYLMRVLVEPTIDLSLLGAEDNFQRCVFQALNLDGEWMLLIGLNHLSYHAIHQELDELARAISAWMKSSKFILSYSFNRISLGALPSEAANLRTAARGYFYDANNQIILVQSKAQFTQLIDFNQLEVIVKNIFRAFDSNDRPAYENAIQAFGAEIQSQKYHPDAILPEIKSLLQQMVKKIRNFHLYKDDLLADLARLEKKLDDPFITLGSITEAFHQILAIYFNRACSDRLITTKPEIGEAIRYIQQNYKKDVSLAELAEHVGISKNYFCMIFKQETGENFIDYVNKLRINEAILLMSEKNYHVKQASYEVGIINQRYFCRLFKRYTGRTPSEYKSRNARTTA